MVCEISMSLLKPASFPLFVFLFASAVSEVPLQNVQLCFAAYKHWTYQQISHLYL